MTCKVGSQPRPPVEEPDEVPRNQTTGVLRILSLGVVRSLSMRAGWQGWWSCAGRHCLPAARRHHYLQGRIAAARAALAWAHERADRNRAKLARRARLRRAAARVAPVAPG